MEKYAVLGLGRFGQSLAVELSTMGNEVLAVDRNEEHLITVQDYVTHMAVADVADEDAMKELGIDDFDCVIIAIGNDIQDSIMCAIVCKDCNVKRLWAKASSDLHAKALRKIGVDRVILPEKEMGIRIAHHVANNDVVDYLALSDDYQMVEMAVRDEWVGKSLNDVNFRTKYGINIIGIRSNQNFIVAPGANYVINKGDVLCIIGKNSDVEKM